uniref:Protein btg1 n=1 Tax=Centruroides hentzi TaxID=88313 RepID=A0A2I9LNT4_9SCOR
MMSEIRTASRFLANLLRLSNRLDNDQLKLFCGQLEYLLEQHYREHWFPEHPCKGSGYRCLRINHKMDPIIAKAGFACGLEEASLRNLFPNELTLWVDPKEVSYRIGENGSICILYDASKLQQHSDFENQESRNHSSSTNENINSQLFRPSCKESMWNNNNWEHYIMDPRKHFEQLAAYVSS